MIIGILGGSFNPVHLGHLIAAEEVLKKTDCEKIWLMPCYIHALKPKELAAPIEYRMKLLKFVEKNFENIEVSDFEIKKNQGVSEKTYTIDTVKALKQIYPQHTFKWIIGSKLLDELDKWKNIEELVKQIQFIVVPMSGDKKEKLLKHKWVKKNNAVVIDASIVTNISSSEVRKRSKEKQGIEVLVPEKVREYIESKKLYE